MKKLFACIIVLALLVCCISVCTAQCVPEKEAVDSWNMAVSSMPRDTEGIASTTAECDPCKCPIDGMAGCYSYMAQREREKERQYDEIVALLERAKLYGICK